MSEQTPVVNPGRARRTLTVEFYVGDLTDTEVDALAGEALAQADRSDDHPAVTARVVPDTEPHPAGQILKEWFEGPGYDADKNRH